MSFLQSFSIQRPKALIAFIFILFALVIHTIRYRKVLTVLYRSQGNMASSIAKMKIRFVARCLFLFSALSCFIFAFAGISWGTHYVPVQKSGNAVVLVFDISWSMMAKDGLDGRTRLEDASTYAKALVNNTENVSFAAVLAKGDGTFAVPLTYDKEAVCSLIDNLSPNLMTAPGTSLGKGIESAISSFPVQSSQTPYILLFTDGEETDSYLSSALSLAVGYGINVRIIGFGSEEGKDVSAGDGKTIVHTRLMSDNLMQLAKQPSYKGLVSYVNALEPGSAYGLISMLSGSGKGAEQDSVSYEIMTVDRYNMFIALGILFLILSYFSSELSLSGKKKAIATLFGMSIVLSCFTGCTSDMKNRMRILDGRLEWNRKNYQEATAIFLSVLQDARAAGDKNLEQYALYNLATTYLMQDESDATMEHFDEIVGDTSDDIKFAVYYNMGIVCHRKGDYEGAEDCFKQALYIDSSNVDAKINLELSMQHEVGAKSSGGLVPVSQSSDQALEQALYSIIREQEQEKWKNQQQNQSSNLAEDY